MGLPNSPYISRVKIKNFRNFGNSEGTAVELGHKQVIIGENNVGKTNFLRAIQLILDPSLSDEDRYLTETDFFDGLDDPMANNEIIEIVLEIRGFEHNNAIVAELCDATVSTDPATLRLTYRYAPSANGQGYEYSIFQGVRPDVPFNHTHRKLINIKVISGLRDANSDLKNVRRSPLNALLKQYDIDKKKLEDIAGKMKEQSDDILKLDELIDLKGKITESMSKTLGTQPYSRVSLETVDVNPLRVLNTLKLMIGQFKQRPTEETSLGLTNVLYILMILISLEDRTIPNLLKKDFYTHLLDEEGSDILISSYTETDQDNYQLNEGLSTENSSRLYQFMNKYNSYNEGFTILAIEEPEAHLHPTLQRVIFKDIMKNQTSVLMTTHSPYITSVAPLDSIVYLRESSQGAKINSTAMLELSPKEKLDIERYIDVKRGEIYFGKGIVLIEGVAEEYLIPEFAERIEKPLDIKGIICCNINSTNFKPYVKFLDALAIPFVVITDGDYYIETTNEKGEIKRKYHLMFDDSQPDFGYLGNERVRDLLTEFDQLLDVEIPVGHTNPNSLFEEFGYFIGEYTMEVDVMVNCAGSEEGKAIITEIFNELTVGKEQQKLNFKSELESGDYWACLRKIENSDNEIGKGRFAQRLSAECSVEHVPSYIENAINEIYRKVSEGE